MLLLNFKKMAKKDELRKEETLEEKVARLESESELKDNLIAELQEKAENLSLQKGNAKEVITIGKEKFEVQFPKTSYKGEIISVEDLKLNQDLANELVKIGSGMLKKVESSK